MLRIDHQHGLAEELSLDQVRAFLREGKGSDSKVGDVNRFTGWKTF